MRRGQKTILFTSGFTARVIKNLPLEKILGVISPPIFAELCNFVGMKPKLL